MYFICLNKAPDSILKFFLVASLVIIVFRRQAWRDLQQLSQEEAMEQYVDKLDDIAPDWQEDSKVSGKRYFLASLANLWKENLSVEFRKDILAVRHND